jgi:hypothetical protein
VPPEEEESNDENTDEDTSDEPSKYTGLDFEVRPGEVREREEEWGEGVI